MDKIKNFLLIIMEIIFCLYFFIGEYEVCVIILLIFIWDTLLN